MHERKKDDRFMVLCLENIHYFRIKITQSPSLSLYSSSAVPSRGMKTLGKEKG